ncbi:hypothetical protein [Bernardetia sp. MNP-M8]|uniref:hypothetical protein n=1 Tax=Bernardetia sp. MNP-M8 TaxID=3127470 RepID=UPI0030D34845
MPYHSHTLNSVSHSHIIERTDPITGDSVKENDRVVFCAICKSCFLEHSWVYMNEQHCEQNQTLDSVPTLASKLVMKNRSNEVIAELKNKGVNFTIVVAIIILSFLLSFFGLATSGTFFSFDVKATLIASLLTTITTGILSAIITVTHTFKSLIGSDKNDIRLFRNRIEIGKDSFSWSDIKQIKYQREVSTSTYEVHGSLETEITSYTPYLLIYFNEGKFVNYRLPTNSYKQGKLFLEGLARISHFTEVFLYSENYTELHTINLIQSSGDGNIQVGKPRKVVNNKGIPVFTTSDR